MGANTYRLMSELAADGEPGTDALAGLSKVVFSSTLKEPLSWPNTQLVSRSAGEAVREMKETGTTPMRIGQPRTMPLSVERWSRGPFSRCRLPGHHREYRRDRIYDGYPDVSLDMVSSRTFDRRQLRCKRV